MVRTMHVSTQEQARAVVNYAADIQCEHAVSSYNELTHWHDVVVDCTTQQHLQLISFVDGLEWFTAHDLNQ
jgi:hypothetical protein